MSSDSPQPDKQTAACNDASTKCVEEPAVDPVNLNSGHKCKDEEELQGSLIPHEAIECYTHSVYHSATAVSQPDRSLKTISSPILPNLSTSVTGVSFPSYKLPAHACIVAACTKLAQCSSGIPTCAICNANRPKPICQNLSRSSFHHQTIPDRCSACGHISFHEQIIETKVPYFGGQCSHASRRCTPDDVRSCSSGGSGCFKIYPKCFYERPTRIAPSHEEIQHHKNLIRKFFHLRNPRKTQKIHYKQNILQKQNIPQCMTSHCTSKEILPKDMRDSCHSCCKTGHCAERQKVHRGKGGCHRGCSSHDSGCFGVRREPGGHGSHRGQEGHGSHGRQEVHGSHGWHVYGKRHGKHKGQGPCRGPGPYRGPCGKDHRGYLGGNWCDKRIKEKVRYKIIRKPCRECNKFVWNGSSCGGTGSNGSTCSAFDSGVFYG